MEVQEALAIGPCPGRVGGREAKGVRPRHGEAGSLEQPVGGNQENEVAEASVKVW